MSGGRWHEVEPLYRQFSFDRAAMSAAMELFLATLLLCAAAPLCIAESALQVRAVLYCEAFVGFLSSVYSSSWLGVIK